MATWMAPPDSSRLELGEMLCVRLLFRPALSGERLSEAVLGGEREYVSRRCRLGLFSFPRERGSDRGDKLNVSLRRFLPEEKSSCSKI